MNLQKLSVTGLIVYPYGLASEVTILPEHSGGGHLHGMYQALGCRAVDCVQLTAKLDMWLDDEGMFNQGINGPASYVALRYGFNWQYYNGTVLFLGGPDDEGLMFCDETTVKADAKIAL